MLTEKQKDLLMFIHERMQERGVPPWLRAGMPAVFAGERLLYVAGLGMDCAHEPAAAGAVRLRWQPDDPGDPRAAFGE